MKKHIYNIHIYKISYIHPRKLISSNEKIYSAELGKPNKKKKIILF